MPKNDYGELGSPCRILMVSQNSSFGAPLNITEKEIVVTSLVTNVNSSKPNFSIIASKYLHSTRA
jgi:hypothetical protein